MNAESHLFDQRFDQYGQWRFDLSQNLRALGQWLADKNLADGATLERLHRLQEKAFSGKITVAFVAEFSRGKSELINALFFSSYGQRIMPASAGRTTMCPTELTWEAGQVPGIRLLPIETRKLSVSLADWRLKESSWTQILFDARSADSVAAAIRKVTETIHVDVEEARHLGFWADGDEEVVQLQSRKAGLVEVPKWRHAVINFPHPLLKKGLVILDTPGLNAIGVEPELTVSLLPQAQAVLFILGADTGVTRSDLSIWQDQLLKHVDSIGLRLVVLNKIDTLWDELSSKDQQAQQIRKQRQMVSQILDVPPSHVLAVSAQKALVAKVNRDHELLKESCIRQLESVLVESLLGERHQILNKVLFSGIAELRTQAEHLLNLRIRDITEQAFEISGLQGKNSAAMRSVRMRIARERKEFDSSVNKVMGLRAAHHKLINEVFQQLSAKAVKKQLVLLAQDLERKMLTMGSQKLYRRVFDNLREVLLSSQETINEIQRMLTESYTDLNTEFGFSLQAPQSLDLRQFTHDLQKIADSNAHFFSIGNAFKMTSAEFAKRLVSAIGMRLRSVFEAASNELELWSKASTAQLDLQLRERRQSFASRSETMERIQQADVDLNVRQSELEQQINALKKDSQTLAGMTQSLIQAASVKAGQSTENAAR